MYMTMGNLWLHTGSSLPNPLTHSSPSPSDRDTRLLECSIGIKSWIEDDKETIRWTMIFKKSVGNSSRNFFDVSCLTSPRHPVGTPWHPWLRHDAVYFVRFVHFRRWRFELLNKSLFFCCHGSLKFFWRCFILGPSCHSVFTVCVIDLLVRNSPEYLPLESSHACGTAPTILSLSIPTIPPKKILLLTFFFFKNVVRCHGIQREGTSWRWTGFLGCSWSDLNL